MLLLKNNNSKAHLYISTVTRSIKPAGNLPNSICLIDSKDILQKAQKDFTITTKNGSYKFNKYVLKELSLIISNIMKKNPHNLQYNLDINDDRNVISKFEQICKGDIIVLEADDLPMFRNLTKELLIKNCSKITKGLGIEIQGLSDFFKKKEFNTFSIQTNKNIYHCNIFGVTFSNTIFDLITKNPKTNTYIYNFDDENNEFQIICDLFNFNIVKITNNNIDLLKKLCEDLQIDYILNNLNIL